MIATGFEENQTVPFPHQKEEAAAPAAEESSAPAVPAAPEEAPAAEQPAAPAEPEPPKPAVNDDDWDILERIFSKKR